ncbi:MAG TPA: hypothetical protein VHJ76_05385 [Actinomycetota bacterium]|nr:hypothetical protein [Actinomycetota bacterium]
MNDVEAVLAATLSDRADRLVPWPGHRDATLRRMRRRRVRNGLVAGVVAVALGAGGVVAVRGVADTPAVRPAHHAEVAASEYPYVAKGSYRGARWTLRAAAVRLAPRADVRLTVQIRQRFEDLISSTYVRQYDDPLFVRYEPGSHLFGGEVAIVFGAAAPAAQTIDVVVDGGGTVPAHVFTGYDVKTTLEADYYLAFVPADASGAVVARDAEGHTIESEVIPQR